MSGYLPPSSAPRRRQPSTTSTLSSDYSFPSSRSTTVTSNSSLSSRFTDYPLESAGASPTEPRKHSSSFGAGGGYSSGAGGSVSPMLSPYGSSTPAAQDPRPLPSSPALGGSPLGSTYGSRHVRGASVPAIPPSASPRPGISPYNSANRNSMITGTSSLNKDDISHLRSSSVSHFRTLSKLTREGSADEFKIDTGQDVAGMHGRKRLQRAPTDNMTSWERMTWMDKKRQYIQAYEYLCHIGEAKE